MADLKTDYKDDILDTSQNTRRKYQMVDNGDGTVSFVDVTEYIQQGDSFGADDVNAITDAINKNDGVPVGAVVTFDGSQLPSGFEPYTTTEQSAIQAINSKLSITDVSSEFYFDTTAVKNTYLKAYRYGNIISVYAVYKPIGNIPENTPFLFSQTYDVASHIVGTGSAGSYWVGPVAHKIDVRPIGVRTQNIAYYLYFTFITTTA